MGLLIFDSGSIYIPSLIVFLFVTTKFSLSGLEPSTNHLSVWYLRLKSQNGPWDGRRQGRGRRTDANYKGRVDGATEQRRCRGRAGGPRTSVRPEDTRGRIKRGGTRGLEERAVFSGLTVGVILHTTGFSLGFYSVPQVSKV